MQKEEKAQHRTVYYQHAYLKSKETRVQLSCQSQREESVWPPNAEYFSSALPHWFWREINPGSEIICYTEIKAVSCLWQWGSCGRRKQEKMHVGQAWGLLNL